MPLELLEISRAEVLHLDLQDLDAVKTLIGCEVDTFFNGAELLAPESPVGIGGDPNGIIRRGLPACLLIFCPEGAAKRQWRGTEGCSFQEVTPGGGCANHLLCIKDKRLAPCLSP